MELNAQENLILRITEYALKENSFPLVRLKDDLGLDQTEYEFVGNNFVYSGGQSGNPNHLLARSRTDVYKGIQYHFYSLLPTAFYNYVDYLEIIQARKSADQAKKLSWYAIWISIGLGVGQILIGVFQLTKQL